LILFNDGFAEAKRPKIRRVSMKFVRKVLPFLIVAALLAIPAYAQQGSITGKVIDTEGKPMVGVLISIDSKGITRHFEVKTDAKGSYFHAGLPTGVYKITVMKDGTALNSADNVRITFGGTTPVDFDLQKMAAQAPPAISAEEQAKLDAEKKAQEETKNAFNNGLAALQAKQYAEAATLLKEAADKDPTQHVIFANLGEAYSGARKYEEAIGAYNKAIELKPDEFGYYNNLGIAYGSAGKIDEAIKTLTKAGEINPTQAPQAFYNLGAVLTNRGRSKEAADAFKKAIELKPDMSQAYLQLGISLIGNPATMGEAAPYLEKFLTMNPNPTDKDTATQLLAMAKSAGGSNASYKSPAAIAKEKADAEKAQKEAEKNKSKQKKP
jgi:tetratricopeptide (TPR) repeat protein